MFTLDPNMPQGVESESSWKERRFQNLCAAIGRYIIAGIEPPPEWAIEGKELKCWLDRKKAESWEMHEGICVENVGGGNG